MIRLHLLSLILIAALCSCDRPHSHETRVTISDPGIKTSEDIIKHLEAATLTGATEVSINSHTWSFKTPFHSNRSVDLESPPVATFDITEQTTELQIKAWLEMNQYRWITYTPSAHSSRQIFWTVVDTMESFGTDYSTSYPDSESLNLGRLEAIEATQQQSK